MKFYLILLAAIFLVAGCAKQATDTKQNATADTALMQNLSIDWDRNYTPVQLCSYDGEYIPIIYYHNIENVTSSDLNEAYDAFESQMKFFYTNGYDSITLAQFDDFIHNKTCINKKSVVIIFDDGFSGVYDYAYPLMDKLGYVGVVALLTGHMSDSNRMSYAQAVELHSHGWEIASHSDRHENLLNVSLAEAEREFNVSKEKIAAGTGITPRDFVTPYNFIGNDSLELCEKYYSLCTGLGHSEAWDCNYFKLRPVDRYLINVRTNFSLMQQRIERCVG